MKIGDTLICHTTCVMSDDGSFTTTVGKLYKVIDIRESLTTKNISIVIINDDYEEHLFPIEKCSSSNGYEYWFHNIQEERKKKLQKINKLEEF